MSLAKARLSPLLLLSLLAGCSTLPSQQTSSLQAPAAMVDASPTLLTRVPAAPVSAATAPPAPEKATITETMATPTLVRGTDRLYAPPGPKPGVRLSGDRISLNFDQAPIVEVVHAVIGDLLGLPYVIHEPVGGTVTIQTRDPLPADQLLAVFESLMLANGLAIVRDPSGVHHVGRPEAVRGIAPVFAAAGNLPPGHKLVVVPLRYVGATAMAEILEAFAGTEAVRRVDRERNLLVMAGTGTQVQGWLEIVDSFDVDVLAGMSVGLFPLHHVPVRQMERALDAVMGGLGATAGDPATAGAEAIAAGSLAGLLRLMPIEELNALLVVTPRARYLDVVREWVARFDRAGNSGTEARLYVYPVRNGSAEHLAHLLNAVFDGALAPTGGTQTNVAPGLSPVSLGESGLDAIATTQGNPAASTPEVAQVRLAADVRVVADVRNNALLIHAPPAAYGRIESALHQLDVSPNQVLIEASILEVTLADELRYGLQWALSGGLGGGRSGNAVLRTDDRAGSLPSPAGPGFSYTISSGAGEIRAVLTALADKSLVNVISSPSVLVQDNHTATIQVGDQQPVRTSRSVSDGGTATESIQFKDTGVMLSVTPSVNAGGLVTMAIDQSVTDVGQVDAATGQRSFLQRQISSRVSVRSGESVVLGGLIRDNSSRGRQGVPGLQDVPVLGSLFSTTTRNTNRTELLVMITPRVVRNELDLRQLGEDMRRRMRALEPLRERAGSLALSEYPAQHADTE